MLNTLAWVVRRDLLLAWRRRTDVMTPLCFFVIVSALFPLAVGADRALLRTLAPGALWVAALLASMLSLQRLFAPDHADGTLTQLLLSPEPLPLIVLGKVLAHWLASGLPLALVAPLMGLQFGLPVREQAVLVAGLLIATLSLSLVGAIGAALTLGARGGGVLVSVLVLPLAVPVLVFGAGAAEAQAAGLEPAAHLLLLGAVSAAALALGPWAASAALRIALE